MRKVDEMKEIISKYLEENNLEFSFNGPMQALERECGGKDFISEQEFTSLVIEWAYSDNWVLDGAAMALIQKTQEIQSISY